MAGAPTRTPRLTTITNSDSDIEETQKEEYIDPLPVSSSSSTSTALVPPKKTKGGALCDECCKLRCLGQLHECHNRDVCVYIICDLCIIHKHGRDKWPRMCSVCHVPWEECKHQNETETGFPPQRRRVHAPSYAFVCTECSTGGYDAGVPLDEYGDDFKEYFTHLSGAADFDDAMKQFVSKYPQHSVRPLKVMLAEDTRTYECVHNGPFVYPARSSSSSSSAASDYISPKRRRHDISALNATLMEKLKEAVNDANTDESPNKRTRKDDDDDDTNGERNRKPTLD